MLFNDSSFNRFAIAISTICAALLGLICILSITEYDASGTFVIGSFLEAGFRAIPWYIYPLVGLVISFVSHMTFSRSWSKLSATFFGCTLTLLFVTFPELWGLVHDATAQCLTSGQELQTLPQGCDNPLDSAVTLYLLFLAAWTINMVAPLAFGTAFLHGWFILLIAVFTGTKHRLKSMAES